MDTKGRRTFNYFRITLLQLTLLTSCFLFSGCELIDLIAKAISGYADQETVGILVYPPFPESFFEAKEQPVRRSNFVFSENVKRALMQGVQAFNDASSTTVMPWYITNEKAIRDLYNELDFGDMKTYLANVIAQHRQEDGIGGDVSAIIAGTFDDKNENATKFTCSLMLFDYRKNALAEQVGPVEKDAGRIQSGELENLMKALLTKVYGD